MVKEWKVGISYERYGYIKVEAETQEEAVEKANKKLEEMTVQEMDAVTEFLEDSEEVDEEFVEEVK